MRRFLFTSLMVLLLVGKASAQGDWKREFEEICSKTEDVMSLSKEELKARIERCDKLKAEIERLDDSARKVYMRRLRQCQDLLKFVFESKEEE